MPASLSDFFDVLEGNSDELKKQSVKEELKNPDSSLSKELTEVRKLAQNALEYLDVKVENIRPPEGLPPDLLGSIPQFDQALNGNDETNDHKNHPQEDDEDGKDDL